MKTDLGKLLAFIWMVVVGYFIYEMWKDLHYLTDLIQAYIQMVVQHSRH